MKKKEKTERVWHHVQRKNLLLALSSVSPGVARREVVEQSSCFCFQNGKVMTYNDELAVSAVSGLPPEITCAVRAEPIITLLSKLVETDIEVCVTKSEFRIKANNRLAGVRCDENVVLAIDEVGLPDVGDPAWQPLAPEFTNGVAMVVQTAARESDLFYSTCIHIHPEFLEACDNYQYTRFPVETPIGESALIKASVARHIVGLRAVSVILAESWVHFRNDIGIVLSCRRWMERFPDASPLLDWKGAKTEFPGGLSECVTKAEIFSSDSAEGNFVKVSLWYDKVKQKGQLKVKGAGSLGWYAELSDVIYNGPTISFMIVPRLLAQLSQRKNEGTADVVAPVDCEVGDSKLRMMIGKATYIACLLAAETED